ncbi:MAG: S8 family serine peptidase [Sandaracinaceae bacterium]|nr:S8 family serine peptidase [Sandaracinaceae bacterium]
MGFLRADPRVLLIEPDREVHAFQQILPTGVDRVEADRSGLARIDGVDQRVDVDVAVIDTGIDLDHPDLNVSPERAVDCTRGGSTTPRCEPGGDDDNGHGTHVAGTIGAIDDDGDVVGIAPGARLWAVKVLDQNGTGWWSQIAGIDWVTARAGVIEVANMSLGGSGSDAGGCGGSSLHLAVCNSVAAGVVHVVAAGNDARDAAGFVPAAYDEVITVSALADFDGAPGGAASFTCRTDRDDSFADFSNFGADVDLMAPGVCIRSTRVGGGTTVYSGTSMASPHVAGAAALEVAARGRDRDGDGGPRRARRGRHPRGAGRRG